MIIREQSVGHEPTIRTGEMLLVQGASGRSPELFYTLLIAGFGAWFVIRQPRLERAGVDALHLRGIGSGFSLGMFLIR